MVYSLISSQTAGNFDLMVEKTIQSKPEPAFLIW